MRTRLALLAAIVLGVVAAIGVRSYLTRKDIEYEKMAVRVPIAVARETLNPGDELKDSAVAMKEVDEAAVSDMHILYDQRKPWLGQKLTRRVRTGKAIFKNDFLQAPGPSDFTVKKVLPGWRAMTIGTDQISGVAGLITPGCRVDVVGTFRERPVGPENATTMVTRVLCRNVEVLAVDNRTDLRVPVNPARRAMTDQGYSSVTLLVNPLEASLLTYAQSAAKLTFTLRNSDDVSAEKPPVPISQSQFDNLLDEAARRRSESIKKDAPK